MLAANGPQTTTPGQYVNVTPVATGQVVTDYTGMLALASVLIGLFFLFGSHR